MINFPPEHTSLKRPSADPMQDRVLMFAVYCLSERSEYSIQRRIWIKILEGNKRKHRFAINAGQYRNIKARELCNSLGIIGKLGFDDDDSISPFQHEIRRTEPATIGIAELEPETMFCLRDLFREPFFITNSHSLGSAGARRFSPRAFACSRPQEAGYLPTGH